MNKLLQKVAKIFLGLSMAAGVGVAVSSGHNGVSQVRADNYTITFKAETAGDGTKDTTGVAVSNYTSSSYVTGNASSPTNSYYNSKAGLKLGASGKAGSVTFTLASSGQVTPTSVVVNAKRYNSGKAATISINSKTAQSLTANFADYTFDGFTTTITSLTIASSNYCFVSSITVNYSGGGGTPTDSVTLSVDPTSLELEVGDTDTFNVSISSTGTYGTEFIVESGDESVATVSPDVGDGDDTITVTAEGAGDTTITVSSIDGGQTATVDVSVSAPFASKNYVLCTSTTDLEAGKSYLITNGTSGSVLTMASSEKANNRDTVSATVSNGKIASSSSMLSVTLGGETGAWTFATENYAGTAGYLNATNTTGSNYLQVVSSLDAYAYFSISFSDSAAVITCTGKNSRNIVRNNGSLISCYTSGYNAVYLWKESDGASLSLDMVKHLDYVGHGFELEATADGYEPTSWAWSSDPAGIVNISNSNGVASVTPSAAGTTTISVTASSSGTTKTATCAVTITSKSGADTSNALSVNDAILIAKYTGTTKTSSYYMEGIVSSMASDKYPMLSGTSDSLEVFKDCSSTVYSGDTIRVYGPIFNYNNSQPEFDGTSTVSVINIPVDTITVSNPTPIPTSIEDGDLSDYLSVTVNGTNDRTATNQTWTVTNSSNTSVISLSGADGKTFDSGSTAGSTTLTVASVGDSSITAIISVTTLDASTPVLQSVTVTGTPSKLTQYEGKTFDWTGLTFTPVYSPVKSPVESITGANITWNALVAGQNPTGTYTGDDEVSVTVTVTSVSVETDGIYSVHVSGDMSIKSYDEQATSWNYSGLVVKVTYLSDHNTQVDPESDITWSASSTPAQLGKGTEKSVNVTASVGGVSSSAYGITGITITEHEADKYGEYTGAITAGQYVIVAADRTTALTASISSNRFANTSMTISSGIIEDPSASVVWTIEQVSGTNYWSIYNASTEKYAGGTSSKNQGALLASVDDLAKWTITYDETDGYTFENYGRTIAQSDTGNAYLRQNSTESNGWATYASSTGKAPTLYKLNYLPKAWASFNYVDGTPDKTSYMVGETFNPSGLEIHAVYTEPTIYPEEDITSEIVWDTLVEGTQATGSWDGHTVTITGLTISSFAPDTYTKLTSLDQLAVGSEVIIGGYKSSATTYYALSNFDGSKYFTAVTTTGTDSTLLTTSDTLIFTVEADRNGYYFKNGNNYIKRNSGDSGFGSKDSNACWTITFGEEGAVTMTNGDSGNTAFQFNDSQPRFKNYAGTQKSISIYVKTTPSETDILKTYVSRYLLLENETLTQIPSGQTGDAGTDCLGSTGPYMTAKAALNSGEFSSHKSNFQSSNDSIIANARLRYEAWATAYGDITPYDAEVQSSRNILSTIIGNNTNSVAIIVIISMVSVTAIGGYFFIRKRKEQ